jgi:adenylate cyclase
MRERRKVTGTFARYVSPKVLEYLLESHQLPPLGGERKEITVLFSDIRSFTTISESTPPDLLVEWLNDYFSLLVTVIFKHQGTFDKFIGDAVMAYWGAPTPQADHAERAVRCAREMVIELKKWNAERAAKGLPPLNNGVGIHSGPAVVGEMGAVVEGRRQVNFTCLGDTVNTASRVEGLTKGYKRSILFTEGTARLLPPDLAVEALGSTEVKGKLDSVTIFSLKEDL